MHDQDQVESRRPVEHRIGEPLDTLSVEEIVARVALLAAEIARLEAVRDAKKAAREHAGSIFRS